MAAVRQPANAALVRYFERSSPKVDEAVPRPDKAEYLYAGSHPDVVERVWDRLGQALPPEARRVVLGTPALLHPGSKIVLVVAMGTQYAIRLPAAVRATGLPVGIRTETVWGGGVRMSLTEDFGPEWVFGGYDAREMDWVRQAFDEAAPPG